MNLKQRYRGSIYRRTLKFLISYSFLFIILFYTNTYSKFATEHATSTQTEIAKWEVEVTADGVANNTTIVLVPDADTSVNGKIYPGSTGHFDIVVNPNNTEVSINYIINFSNLPDGISLTNYEFLDDPGHTKYTVYNNSISELINLNANREALSSADSKTLRIYWEFGGVKINANSIESGGIIYTIDVAVTARQSLNTTNEVKVKFVYSEGPMRFGNTCLNADIGLFSEDNINRDFELTLDIDQTTYNTAKGAYVSCMDHLGDGFWPGFMIRTPNANNIAFIRRSTNSNKVENHNVGIQALKNIKLVRTGTVLYYDFNNSGNLQQALDYYNLAAPFTSPLKFGADFNSSMTPTTFCLAVMSNITLQNTYAYTERNILLPSPTRTGYEFGGWYSDGNFTNKVGNGGDYLTLPENNISLYAKWILNDNREYSNYEYAFDGTNAINTQFYPFSENNMHKNFEIYFDMEDLVASDSWRNIIYSENNVIMFRIADVTKEQFQIRSSVNNTGRFVSFSTKSIKILRIDDKIYYSTDANNLTLLVNLENYTTYSELPIVIGGSCNDYGKISNASYSCTFNNIRLRYLSDDVTLEDFEKDNLALNKLQIGDYVAYTNVVDPSLTNGEYVVNGQYSGTGTDQTLTATSGLNWIVINIDETNKTVDLISGLETSEQLRLQGFQGYNNGVYLLNDICNKFYSNSSKEAVARSVNLQDLVNNMTSTDDILNYKYIENGVVKNQFGYSYNLKNNNYWPMRYYVHDKNFNSNDKLDLINYMSENGNIITNTSSDLATYALDSNNYSTYYSFTSNLLRDVFQYNVNIGMKIGAAIFRGEHNNNRNSFVATRYVHPYDGNNWVEFGIFRMTSNVGIFSFGTARNGESSTVRTNYLRPVVTIPAEYINVDSMTDITVQKSSTTQETIKAYKVY